MEARRGEPLRCVESQEESSRSKAWPLGLPAGGIEQIEGLAPGLWPLASATKSVYTSAALRVEIRESFTSLTTFLDSIAANEVKTDTLYEVENLPLLGTPGSDTLIEQTLSATFQALPFAEPATGLVYARARWYDPATGSFLTP
jgi:hypothetical protein